MARTLTATVHGLRDPDGQVVSLHPGDDLPAWAKDMVTNPAAFGVDTSADDDGLAALEHEQDDDDPEALIDGTIDEVTDRVGGDKALAKAALEAEEAKGAKARTTLLSELRAILGQD